MTEYILRGVHKEISERNKNIELVELVTSYFNFSSGAHTVKYMN